MVDLRTFGEVENVVRSRLRRMKPEIERSLTQIAEGNPLAAETQTTRRIDRLQVKAGLSREEAGLISSAIDMIARDKGARAGKMPGPEAILGSTLDFVGVSFLERGRRAADAVGRIAFLNEGPQGTGFLVAPNLLLTNHHVIESAAASGKFQVQFDYEYDVAGRARNPTSFLFDPTLCFVTDSIEGLDFTLIGIGERRSGTRRLEEFGFIPLSDASDKHMLGEIANVIQHPDGRFKELVLRENHLVARDETQQVLHYVADTEQGSSGSPVFNNEWEPIALHHWGGPWLEVMGTDGRPLAREINEGIRISAIVRYLREARLAGAGAEAVRRALAAWDSARRPETNATGAPLKPTEERVPEGPQAAAIPKPGTPNPRHNPDGSVTWTFPIEISVRAPLAAPPVVGRTGGGQAHLKTGPLTGGAAEAASWETEDFSDRGGYEPGFVPGHSIPLPDFSGTGWRPAKNQIPPAGGDPNELPYHHFSIVMNADRRLCGVTAVNIDGGRIKAINRQDKTVIDEPSLKDLGVESIGADGAEASDDFRPDRRVLLEEQMNRPFYEKQIVKGFLDTKSPERTARIFQKGHIVLRGDPAWGSETEALSAERDTFFYTNAAPQIGFFNQGSALDRPGSKGKLRWRAVETYVLRNAVTMKQRVSVFAGPVFDEADPPYRFASKVPLRFWKIAVWSDRDSLRAIALLADQKPVLQIMPEAISAEVLGPEAYGDEEELARVSEFLSSVEEIEALTKLDFGDQLRTADIRAGRAATPAITLDPADLEPPRSGTSSGAGPAGRARPRRKRSS
ncbi:DNA/RNA non-specific endonuclease [Rhizobium mesosinicum]|uniref:Serine protease n=1 Tax=Rhizobium mesosinicum TaxID=335017 RepID=A0ABS7GUF6_9HYPH|nr:DNA/RNA non-specific endonuclease [Rhizobium mesosinicum]MBW9052975.1 DNA/RNA non-specific endonuclease [Rhizobium mesosinicum]